LESEVGRRPAGPPPPRIPWHPAVFLPAPASPQAEQILLLALLVSMGCYPPAFFLAAKESQTAAKLHY
jgi:hypothetical protein